MKKHLIKLGIWVAHRGLRFALWLVLLCVGVGVIFVCLGIWARNYNLAVARNNLQSITEVRQCYKDFSGEGEKDCAKRAIESERKPIYDIRQLLEFPSRYNP